MSGIAKTVIVLRAFQLSGSIVFLIFISWIKAIQPVADGHPVSMVLRFLAAILSIIFTAYEVVMVVRHDDLRQHRRLYKLGRLYLDFFLFKLWLIALLVAFLVGTNTMLSNVPNLVTLSWVASVMWVVEIILFLISSVVVIIQTVQNWKRAPSEVKDEPVAYQPEYM